MQYLSLYPYFIILGFVFVVASAIAKLSFFSKELTKEESFRLSHLDGLRGILALSIFFHHSIIMYFYYLSGQWKVPASTFYTLLGQLSVGLFFMITGFLFWSKILNSKFEIIQFFLRRIQRIVPLYIFTTSLVILIVFIVSDFTLNMSIGQLFLQIIRWFSFSFLGTPDINGFNQTYTIESVYWTLQWEWMFYFSLPVLLLFRRWTYGVIIILIVLSVYFHLIHVLNFILGMLAAQIYFSKDAELLRHPLFRLASTASIILIFLVFTSGYGVKQSALVFVFFLSVVFGNSIFGLLQLTAIRLLGLISYSIYLMHNIIIWVIFRAWNHYSAIIDISPSTFWFLVSVTAITVVMVSAVTYRFIEHHFYSIDFTMFGRKRICTKTLNCDN